jgi:predicted dinucleotide-utilizing enzyme
LRRTGNEATFCLKPRESILGYLAGGLYGERENWADIAAVVLAMEKLRLSPGYDISPSGTAREAAAGFPANVNVAAALAMAGIGPDRTMMEIWADPSVDSD